MTTSYYHGTSKENAESIRLNGWKLQDIHPFQITTPFQGIYFTKSLDQAIRYTRSKKIGAVLEVKFKNRNFKWLRNIQDIKNIKYVDPDDYKQYAGIIIPSTVAFPGEKKPPEYIVFDPDTVVEIITIHFYNNW